MGQLEAPPSAPPPGTPLLRLSPALPTAFPPRKIPNGLMLFLNSQEMSAFSVSENSELLSILAFGMSLPKGGSDQQRVGVRGCCQKWGRAAKLGHWLLSPLLWDAGLFTCIGAVLDCHTTQMFTQLCWAAEPLLPFVAVPISKGGKRDHREAGSVTTLASKEMPKILSLGHLCLRTTASPPHGPAAGHVLLGAWIPPPCSQCLDKFLLHAASQHKPGSFGLASWWSMRALIPGAGKQAPCP